MASQKLSLADPTEINILAFGDSLTEGYTDFGMRFHPYAIALRQKLSTLFPHLRVTVDVEGRSGDCVCGVLSGAFLPRLRRAFPVDRGAERPKYDLVIALGGTNDLAYLMGDEQAPKTIFEGLLKCYDHVREAGAALLCMTVPERQIDTRTGSEIARRATADRLDLNSKITEYVEKCQEEAAHAGDQNTGNSWGPGKIFMMDLAAMVPFGRDRDESESWSDPIWSPDGLHMLDQGYDFVGEELASFIYSILEDTLKRN